MHARRSSINMHEGASCECGSQRIGISARCWPIRTRADARRNAAEQRRKFQPARRIRRERDARCSLLSLFASRHANYSPPDAHGRRLKDANHNSPCAVSPSRVIHFARERLLRVTPRYSALLRATLLILGVCCPNRLLIPNAQTAPQFAYEKTLRQQTARDVVHSFDQQLFLPLSGKMDMSPINLQLLNQYGESGAQDKMGMLFSNERQLRCIYKHKFHNNPCCKLNGKLSSC